MQKIDYIVVGSGCCGAIAAKTLVEANASVLMLDVGITNTEEWSSENNDFIKLRTQSAFQKQIDMWLGKTFQALKIPNPKKPLHLTPSRHFVTHKNDILSTIVSQTFFPVESFALGGLGNAWGLGSYVFSDQELSQCRLPISEMKKSYEKILKYIGVRYSKGKISDYSLEQMESLFQSFPLDEVGETFGSRFKKNQSTYNSQGFFMERTPLALQYQKHEPNQYIPGQDLDFYADLGKNAYRPTFTIQELKKHPNFTYISGKLVLKYEELNDMVTVETMDVFDKTKECFKAKKLILATGTLNTAKIFMRSTTIKKLPILCNAYSFIPCIQPGLLGKPNHLYKTGLAQWSLYFDSQKTHQQVSMASVYSYRSLLNFRIMRSLPLSHKEGMAFLKNIIPSLFLAGIFHPESPGERKYILLEPDTKAFTSDVLKAEYIHSENEQKQIRIVDKQYIRLFKKMGFIPLKRIKNNSGYSIHYGGTLYDYANKFGKLHTNQRVYVADGSVFKFLPGKGLTLSLMAFAHVCAQNALSEQ